MRDKKCYEAKFERNPQLHINALTQGMSGDLKSFVYYWYVKKMKHTVSL